MAPHLGCDPHLPEIPRPLLSKNFVSIAWITSHPLTQPPLLKTWANANLFPKELIFFSSRGWWDTGSVSPFLLMEAWLCFLLGKQFHVVSSERWTQKGACRELLTSLLGLGGAQCKFWAGFKLPGGFPGCPAGDCLPLSVLASPSAAHY